MLPPPPFGALPAHAAVAAVALTAAWLVVRWLLTPAPRARCAWAAMGDVDDTAMLERVAPSRHGFLPPVVPAFKFDNELDKFVEVIHIPHPPGVGVGRWQLGGGPIPAGTARPVAGRANAPGLPL